MNDWSWPLLVWGVVVGPTWLAATMASYRLLGRLATGELPPPSRLRRYYPLWAAMGIPFGLLAAGFDSVWPDAVLTGYAVLAVGLPFVGLRSLRRILGSAGECENNGACESCPIACSRESHRQSGRMTV